MRYETRDPHALISHRLNATIYGQGDNDEDAKLVESVRQDGVLHPLIILPDGTIISGHRRRMAAIAAGLAEVPCIVRDDLASDDEITAALVARALIASNKQRQKTREQMAREAAELAEIERKLAELRQRASRFTPPQDQAAPTPENTDCVQESTTEHSEKSKEKKHSGGKFAPTESLRTYDRFFKTKEIVASEIGTSEHTAEKLIAAGSALKRFEADGDAQAAAEIRQALSKSASAAAETAKRLLAERDGRNTQPPPKNDKPPLPKSCQPAASITSTLRGIIQRIGAIVSELETMSQQPGGERIMMQAVRLEARELQDVIRSAMFGGVCPYCKGRCCDKCGHLGWMTAAQLDGIPKERRET